MDSLQKYMAARLARNGGFSHRYIASRVYGKKLDLVTNEERSSVSAYLSYEGIKVTEWRNGKTIWSKTYVGKIVRIILPKRLPKHKPSRIKRRKTALTRT